MVCYIIIVFCLSCFCIVESESVFITSWIMAVCLYLMCVSLIYLIIDHSFQVIWQIFCLPCVIPSTQEGSGRLDPCHGHPLTREDNGFWPFGWQQECGVVMCFQIAFSKSQNQKTE
ncbi:hypothetical protein QVD17_13789 [Tagetes erecta]|uniref:Uncharacterized protein n=1 Tax=Tagetes erecta TaxID=13708 RepID=A0AAD8KXG9_TARER|nr:hypothetical protein QVD17_13789 [Tagetes erecta]